MRSYFEENYFFKNYNFLKNFMAKRTIITLRRRRRFIILNVPFKEQEFQAIYAPRLKSSFYHSDKHD